MTVVLRRHLSFHNILLVSIVLRVALVVYSEWHDAHSVVKYTDVDYRVFSDATRFLLNPGLGAENIAKGPLWEWLGVQAFFGE
jgi:phosphatidylinositol glycan class M